MAASSSTSSSKVRLPNEDEATLAVVRAARSGKGMPIALAGAIALLIGAEAVKRVSGWPRTPPYDNGRMEYHVAAAQLDRAGPAEVSIVGSSRTRESLLMPRLDEMLSQAAGRPVTVANYACSGAHTSDFEAMTRRIVRDPRKPRLVLCGVSERDLFIDGDIWDEAPRFWNVADWLDAFDERGWKAMEDLPVVSRNAIGRAFQTLGERELIRFRLSQLARGQSEPDPPSPMEGGLTIWQRSSPARTLVRNPVRRSRVLERSAAIKTSRYPAAELKESLVDMAAACQSAGVPLVFYEVHMSQALRDALPRGLYRKFIAEVQETAAAHGARFVRLADLGLELDDNDMREPSHMSVRGSEKLTDAMARQVVGPALGLTMPAPPPASRPARRTRR